MAIVTLTTDFGTTNTYVGQVKGVILGIAPQATIVDLSHDVPPQDIATGAWALASAVDAFPDGTIHIAVVDPGVGGGRAAVAVQTRHHVLVGPDNGLFTAVLSGQPLLKAVRLSNTAFHRHPVAPTFHGRDIFAPVGAHLANGTPLEDLGDPIGNLAQLDLHHPTAHGKGLKLHVVHIDGFGNLVTDLTADHYRQWQTRCDGADTTTTIRINDHHIHGVNRTFGDVAPGQPVAYFGSSHLLEVAVRNGNASETLGATTATVLYLDRPQTSDLDPQ